MQTIHVSTSHPYDVLIGAGHGLQRVVVVGEGFGREQAFVAQLLQVIGGFIPAVLQIGNSHVAFFIQ